MPKSKRNKIVHLTQVKKKGKDHKDDLQKQLIQYLREYKNVYLFDFESVKNDRIFALRMKLKGCGRIFAGRHSVVAMAFKSFGSRTNTNFDQFLKHVVGHKGLLFTNVACDKLVQLLDEELPEFREKLLGYSEFSGKSEHAEGGESVKAKEKDADNDDNDDGSDDDVNGEGGAASLREVEFTIVTKPSSKKSGKKRQEDQLSSSKTKTKQKQQSGKGPKQKSTPSKRRAAGDMNDDEDDENDDEFDDAE